MVLITHKKTLLVPQKPPLLSSTGGPDLVNKPHLLFWF